jgi:segregation and condensation protein B
VEAVLLLAREPLSSRRVAQLAELEDGTAARTLIRRLNDLYDAAGRAFRVAEIAGGYQLLTRPRFAPWVRRLAGGGAEVRLSQPAMETLAVVAYRQPVLRAEIEAVRGVQCGEILRQLMERGMVRIVGRAEELGRPILYGTTRKFLQVFGLRHLDELPRAAILRRAGDAAMLSESDLMNEEPSTMTALMTETEDELKQRGPETDEDLKAKRALRAADEDDDLDDEDEDEDDDMDEDDEWEEVEDDEEADEEEDDEEWEEDEEDEEWEDEEEDWGDDDEDEDEEEEDDEEE